METVVWQRCRNNEMDFWNKRRPLRGCYEYNTDVTDKKTAMQNGFHRKVTG